MVVATFFDGTVDRPVLATVAAVGAVIATDVNGTCAHVGTSASGNTRFTLGRVAVEIGNMERVAIVTLLCFSTIRGWQWLPRRIAVQTVHVGNRRARYTAGVKENANNGTRVEAGTSGSELDNVHNMLGWVL